MCCKKMLLLLPAVLSARTSYFVNHLSPRRVYHKNWKQQVVHHQADRFPKQKTALCLIDQGDKIIDSLSFRLVKDDDISKCCEMEACSCPGDKAAILDNLKQRRQFAGGYFMCATTHYDNQGDSKEDNIVGFICSTRCREFSEESMSTHDADGSLLVIHSVVVDARHRRQGVGSAMLEEYLKRMLRYSSFDASTGSRGFTRILLLAKAQLLSFYVDCGFTVLRPSRKEAWYELEARNDYLKTLLRSRLLSTEEHSKYGSGISRSRMLGSSRSTSNPEYAKPNKFAKGRNQRRLKLHDELIKLGIDPLKIETQPELFGTAAMRTYNSFILPKSVGALAVTESPTRARVVANSISFLMREHKADQATWLRNLDRNLDEIGNGTKKLRAKHPIVIVLDNVRSAHNVGNILRLAEAAQVESVRLCGMTPCPPHPKVMKTAMGAAEYVPLGDDKLSTSSSTLQTVLDLKAKGYTVYGVETADNATILWDTPVPSRPVAFVFGNELIGIGKHCIVNCSAFPLKLNYWRLSLFRRKSTI